MRKYVNSHLPLSSFFSKLPGKILQKLAGKRGKKETKHQNKIKKSRFSHGSFSKKKKERKRERERERERKEKKNSKALF